MKVLTGLLLFVVVCVVFLGFYNRPLSANDSNNTKITENQKFQTETELNSLVVTLIDGEKTPDLIPDSTAYIQVYRLVDSYKNDKQRRSLRHYIKQNLDITDENDIEIIFQMARKFNEDVKSIDGEVASIREKYHPTHGQFNPPDMERLNFLKHKKDNVAKNIIAKTHSLLKKNSKDKLDKAIKERVKVKIKIKDLRPM